MRRKSQRRALGTGSIVWNERQRRYVAQISLGFDTEGRRVRKQLVGPRGDKSDDAFYALKDRLEQLQRRQPPRKRGQVTSRTTLREYLRGWLQGHTLSEAGLASYTWAVEQHIIPGLGTEKLHTLDRKRLRSFFSNLTTLSRASREKVRTVLGKALHDALENDLIVANPAARLDIRDSFLCVIESSEHLPMFLIMIRGSLGPAETLGLQWRDTQLDRGWGNAGTPLRS